MKKLRLTKERRNGNPINFHIIPVQKDLRLRIHKIKFNIGVKMEEIERLFKRLPDDLKREVIDYMEFLLERRSQEKKKDLKFTWRGGLRELLNHQFYLQSIK